MRGPKALPRRTLILAVVLASWSPAGAGIHRNDGGDPETGSGMGSTWNPTFVCIAEPGDTNYDLLDCLADGLSQPPPPPQCDITTVDDPDTIDDPLFPQDVQMLGPGDDDDCNTPQSPPGFRVERLLPSPPNFGLSIHRDNGTEIDRLWIWENSVNIQMNHVEVHKPGLAGWIGEFVERPSAAGGIVTVWVNDFPVHLDTSLFKKPSKMTQELRLKLADAMFDAQIIRGGIVVLEDKLTGADITSIRLQSTDAAIKSSDLGVAPLEEILVLQAELSVSP